MPPATNNDFDKLVCISNLSVLEATQQRGPEYGLAYSLCSRAARNRVGDGAQTIRRLHKTDTHADRVAHSWGELLVARPRHALAPCRNRLCRVDRHWCCWGREHRNHDGASSGHSPPPRGYRCDRRRHHWPPPRITQLILELTENSLFSIVSNEASTSKGLVR